jgi:serine/threonine-protein kinase
VKLSSPARFGRYLLHERIAIGGMAELFFATAPGDPLLSKGCVIKRVLPMYSEEKQFIEMFLDEAKLGAQLSHPGIARIYDLGVQDKSYFIAMEYLAGEDCEDIIEATQKRGRAGAWPVACAIVERAAEILHFAHEVKGADGKPLNLVHRDVSPSNIFVTYEGDVKMLDFGIARWAHRLGQTMIGFVKGKAGYMAPEQAEGKGSDRRSDVWSLGVCLYELITARPLFEGETTLELALKTLRGNVQAPSSVAIEVPRELDNIVLKALAADPRARYATAAELAAALRRLLPAQPRALIAKRMKLLFGSGHRLVAPTRSLEEPATEMAAPRADSAAETLLVSDHEGRLSSLSSETATLLASDAPELRTQQGLDTLLKSNASLAPEETQNAQARRVAKQKAADLGWVRRAIIGFAAALTVFAVLVARCS